MRNDFFRKLDELEEEFNEKIENLEERLDATDNLLKGALLSLVLTLLAALVTTALTEDTKETNTSKLETSESNK